MTKCGATCCVLVPTPKSANRKGMKSYRAFIWCMFTFMLITDLSCIPPTFVFATGAILAPVGVMSFLFSIMFTPCCKTTKQLRKFHPAYALKLSNYITISWALGFLTFAASMCASSMLWPWDAEYFFRHCIYGPEYDWSYDSRYGVYRLYWSYDSDCAIWMGGFIFSIITSVLAAIQLVFVPYCLRLECYLMDEVKSSSSVSGTVGVNGMDGDRYDIQPQIIEPSPNVWDGGKKNKNKKNKNKNMIDGMPMSDPRVEQLVFAIQGMSGQIRNLQDGIQVKPQQYQQIQTQTQMGQPSVYSQLNNLQ